MEHQHVRVLEGGRQALPQDTARRGGDRIGHAFLVLEAERPLRIVAVGSMGMGVDDLARDRDAQLRRGAGARELGGVVFLGLGLAMQGRNEGRYREALLRGLARLGPVVTRPVERGSRRDARQRIDHVTRAAWTHATLRAPSALLGAQPSAGATFSANSSIERRIEGCGGSIE